MSNAIHPNVLSVISDKKIGVSSDGSTVDYYRAEVLSQSDYYPLGMEQPYRQYRLKDYRFGFNGQEKDNEINGIGNSYTAPFWQYDPRAGLRWNLDPKPASYLSPYAVFNNNPILFGDPLGDTTIIYGTAEVTGTTLSDKGGTSDIAGMAFTYKETSFVPAVDKNNKLIGYNIWDLKNQTLKHPVMQIEPGDMPDFVKHYNAYLMGARLYYANGEPSEGMKKVVAGSAGNSALYWQGLKQEWNNALHDPVFVANLLLSMAHASISMAEPSTPIADLPTIGFTVRTSKFDYFFGRFTAGSSDNIRRSADNLRDLSILGIKNESQLMDVFNQAFEDGAFISTKTSQWGTTITKSVQIGNKGAINVGFFYEEGNMSSTPSVSTLIPKIYKQ